MLEGDPEDRQAWNGREKAGGRRQPNRDQPNESTGKSFV